MRAYLHLPKIHIKMLFCASTTSESRANIWYLLNAFDSLLIGTPNVLFCNCSMFCCALLCVHSSFAIILMGKRELIALLCLSSWCLMIVVWLFLTMPRVCLQFVIVVFAGHTHLLFSHVDRACIFTVNKHNSLFYKYMKNYFQHIPQN